MASPQAMTAAIIRDRLAGTRMPDDPTAVVLPPGSEDWPEQMRRALTAALKPAGVLIPLVQRSAELAVILTERSAELKHHAGQISFPGGRMEASDDDISVTALRETHEEVGIPPAEVSVIGYLPPMPTVTGYAVTPVVGLVARDTPLVIDRSEVSLAFEVPLEFLLDPRNARAAEREFNGRRVPIVEFHYEGHRIWGATAHMLLFLREKLL